MAQDAKGNSVGFGDYVTVKLDSLDGPHTVVRILRISEGTKGTSAIGGYVSLTGNGRVGRTSFDPSASELVLKHEGEKAKAGKS